ncbi:MAG: alpha-L-fucosidase [Eubacterium sp.]|nr:alpha-L-fucosidase [Eubacterium sp.]
MKIKLDENWTTKNNGYALNDSEVERYISVLPSPAQFEHAKKPFYCFLHFGMNTSTGREWGNGTETVDDFKIVRIDAAQWIKTVKASGATGVILTCKHHDGFCLWNTGTTDFNVMKSAYAEDVVKKVSEECKKQGIDFGVYLSPWDMHEKTYATPLYNDFFCRQLTELLTNYGDIFEVWFDGAKGAEAKEFDYDWERYYKIVRTLQPNANIAICGPDIRWVGNEAGQARENEYCVVPEFLTRAEIVSKSSQHSEQDAKSLQKITSKDEDLGSRKVLKKNAYLTWYPAEVDVSIRNGWFASDETAKKIKSAKKLFDIYLNSVGNNSFLLLNVPPTDRGVISKKETKILKSLGNMIKEITEKPVYEKDFGEFKETDGYIEFRFDSPKKLKYCVLKENIKKGQRVEKFDLFLLKENGKYKKAYKGSVIGMRKIIRLKGKASGALLVIRQSRGTPNLSHIGFYE